jgi:hypothetical protein
MSDTLHQKFQLKSLHEEIDLYDRKLAHLQKYETFATDAARQTALAKMTAKRQTLANTAKRMAEEGVAFSNTDLPRSFRLTADPAVESAAAPAAEPAAALAKGVDPLPSRPQGSPFTGTSLDAGRELLAYKKRKDKSTGTA